MSEEYWYEGIWKYRGREIPFSGNSTEEGMKERERIMGGRLVVHSKGEARKPEDERWASFWEGHKKNTEEVDVKTLKQMVVEQPLDSAPTPSIPKTGSDTSSEEKGRTEQSVPPEGHS